MKSKLYLVLFVACLVVAGIFSFNNSKLADQKTPAPASTFVFLDGSTQTTQELQGKVVLVNFWATSCSICVAEMPFLASTYEKYRTRGFETIAVSMQYDAPSAVVRFAKVRKLPFPVAIDNTGQLAQAWDQVRATPTTYLVNKKGEVVKRFIGKPSASELEALIETMLTEV